MGSDSCGCLESVNNWLFAPSTDRTDDDIGQKLPGEPRHSHRSCDEAALSQSYFSDKTGLHWEQPRPTTPIRAASPPPLTRARLQQPPLAPSSVHEMGWLHRFFLRSSRGRTSRRLPVSISRPTNFQHMGSGAVNLRTSAQSFRPLQLSIYEPNNRGVSPLLPYFIGPRPNLALPEPARTRPVFDDDEATLRSRSHSDTTFHAQHQPVGDSNDSPPKLPQRAKTRTRAHTYTSPSVEVIVERIASAIIEKDILDAEIHSIKSRASMCLSRPSTSYDLHEPLPALPLIPPTAPSFAERVSIDRPRTAPSAQTAFRPPPPLLVSAAAPALPQGRNCPRPSPFPERQSSFKAPQWKPNHAPRSSSVPAPGAPTKQPVRASAFNSHPPLTSPKIIDDSVANSMDVHVPLAPPLPLILRPPLRKKKSFSRVSDWLFPADAANDNSSSSLPGARRLSTVFRRHMSTDSVTNAPKALTGKEGFYQTLPPSALFSGSRHSFDSSPTSAPSPLPSPSSEPSSEPSSHPLTGSVYSTDDERAGHGPGTVATASSIAAAAAGAAAWSPGSTPPEEVWRLAADGWHTHEAGRLAFGDGWAGDGGPDEEMHAWAQARPKHLRQASMPAPRPTSVGVAF